MSLVQMPTRSIPPYGEAPKSMAASEWRARIDLAAAYRLIGHYGWSSLIYNTLPRGFRTNLN